MNLYPVLRSARLLLTPPRMSPIACLHRHGTNLLVHAAAAPVARPRCLSGYVPITTPVYSPSIMQRQRYVWPQRAHVREFFTIAPSRDPTHGDVKRTRHTDTGPASSHEDDDSEASGAAALEQRLMSLIRMNNANYFRILVAVLAVVFSCLVLWSEDIKDYFSAQTADVATGALEQEQVHLKTKIFIEQLLADPHVLDTTADFGNAYLADESTKVALAKLFQDSLKEQSTKDTAQNVASQVALDVINDPQTMDQLVVVLQTALQRTETRQACIDLLAVLAADPATQAMLADLFVSVLQTDAVQQQISQLAAETTHTVLSDESVIEHAKNFATSVLMDGELHAVGGDALWNAVTYSVTPSWFRSKPSPEADKSADSKADESTGSQTTTVNSGTSDDHTATTAESQPPQLQTADGADSLAAGADTQLQTADGADSSAAGADTQLEETPQLQLTATTDAVNTTNTVDPAVRVVPNGTHTGSHVDDMPLPALTEPEDRLTQDDPTFLVMVDEQGTGAPAGVVVAPATAATTDSEDSAEPVLSPVADPVAVPTSTDTTS